MAFSNIRHILPQNILVFPLVLRHFQQHSWRVSPTFFAILSFKLTILRLPFSKIGYSHANFNTQKKLSHVFISCDSFCCLTNQYLLSFKSKSILSDAFFRYSSCPQICFIMPVLNLQKRGCQSVLKSFLLQRIAHLKFKFYLHKSNYFL